MNLKELFDMQKKLDEHIIKEKGLEGQDLLPKKILALQVELGELANEWRGFKFWSNNQEPRTKVPLTAWGEPYRNPLLEEYVDCLHFFLSIGNDLDSTERFDAIARNAGNDITSIILATFHHVGKTKFSISLASKQDHYMYALEGFMHLGKKLGFTWEQIVQAYKDKNEVNHQRQENGY